MKRRDLYVGLVYLAVALANALGRYGHVAFGDGTVDVDAARSYRPLAEAVHAGTPLYLDGAATNKPPGFLLVDVAVASLGDAYVPAFLLAVGLCNFAAAFLVYRYVAGRDWRAGVVAGGIYLLSLYVVSGYAINVRSFAVVFLMASFVASRPVVRGGLFAVAGLFTQYVVFLLPLVALPVVARRFDARKLLGLAVGGVGTTALAWGVVGGLWGGESVLAGLNWTYGLPTGVETSPAWGDRASSVAGGGTVPSSYLARSWLVARPGLWLARLGLHGVPLLPVLVAAGMGVHHAMQGARDSFRIRLVAGAALGFVPFLVRTFVHYWLLPLPFLSGLAALYVVCDLPEMGSSRETVNDAE
jgi:hypothetical protein